MALLESPKAMVQDEDAPKGRLDIPDCPYCHRPMGDGCEEETNSLQRDDARFKAIWSKEMGEAGQGSVYRSVSVLLISWDDKAGDLNTEEEVRTFA